MHYLLGLTPGGVQNLIQVDQYLSFVMAMMLAFGFAFEVPLLIVMLNVAGILTHERFRKWRRVLIFGVPDRGYGKPEPGPADPPRCGHQSRTRAALSTAASVTVGGAVAQTMRGEVADDDVCSGQRTVNHSPVTSTCGRCRAGCAEH